MKIAFYDSGIGGLTVLKPFIDYYGNTARYYYLGDSARAPYGEKSKEELISYVKEACKFFENFGVDLFVSACNTSSNYFSEIDFSKYKFKVLSLHEACKYHFENHKQEYSNSDIKFIATPTNVDSQKYKDWQLDKISAISCSKLVPLIEKRCYQEAARVLEEEYLQINQSKFDSLNRQMNSDLEGVTYLLLGCTHYAFLKKFLKQQKYRFIDPALLALGFSKKILRVNEDFELNKKKSQSMLELRNIFLDRVKIYCTGDISALTLATKDLKLDLI